jgi:hypothetical protein
LVTLGRAYEGRARGGEDAVAERLTPPGDAGVGVHPHEQHVDAGAGLPAEHRRGPVDQHGQVEDDGLDACDLHGPAIIGDRRRSCQAAARPRASV